MGNNGKTIPTDLVLIDMGKIIRSQKSTIVKNLPALMVDIIKKVVHQEEVNNQIIEHHDKFGIDFVLANMNSFNITTTTIGL